ncbi:MAG: prepilin-type N-terminal cleavage/methylation domain-containing protein [Xanthomonadales bacterium]
MNRNPTGSIRSRARGITLVEILIVISVLVVLASFAIPSIGNATARAEITAASENVRYSIEAARKLARSTESPVVLRVSDAPGPGGQGIGFGRVKAGGAGNVQDYRLPKDVRLVAATDSFEFDRRGLVEQPGQLVLVSTVDESITETIVVD